jgi:dihydrofolate synthase / folylpolyglutamate synthase
MEYRAAIDYLYSLGHETLTMKLGLENISNLAERMGSPEQAYKIVHVAGTNGKGSFCAMLASILARASIRTGLFTSPHLIGIEERFRLDLEPISRKDFCRLMERVKKTVDSMLVAAELEARPTFFEHVTALGFEFFRERAAQLAILEVGLGGRFDSTNIITPVLSVITPVDYDHQQYLGNTLEEIAGEKAGILKPGVPALIAPQRAEAESVIEGVAERLGSKLYRLDTRNLSYRKGEDGYWNLDFTSDHHRYENLRVGLRGRHQAETAALAILAAERLVESGLSISPEQIREGIEAVDWPGRLELIRGRPTLLLDGAHNPGGIKTLREFLEEWLPEQIGQASRTLIFSTMRDKDIRTMAETIFPLFDRVILAERDDPRSIDPAVCRDKLPEFADRLLPANGAVAALAAAKELTPPDGLIVASGSLHLVGEIKVAMLNNKL